MTKVKVTNIRVNYEEEPTPQEPTEGETSTGLSAALRPQEEPQKKKGWWRKFWDWVWG